MPQRIIDHQHNPVVEHARKTRELEHILKSMGIADISHENLEQLDKYSRQVETVTYRRFLAYFVDYFREKKLQQKPEHAN